MINWLIMKRLSKIPILFFILLLLSACATINSTDYDGYEKLDFRVAIALRFMKSNEDSVTTNPNSVSVEEIRESSNASAIKYRGTLVKIEKVNDMSIRGPEGDIPIRIYTPNKSRDLPIIVFCHGGGWVTMNLETHDNICRKLSKKAEAIVVSVDYRLAPENPFPAGLNDAYAVLEWVSKNGASISGDQSKIIVAGDSSGGNIAAALCLKARDNNGPKISHQVLIYPAMDLSRMDRDSYQRYSDGYLLTKKRMKWFCDQYIENPEELKDPLVSPLLAEDFSNLPPATIINAEIDILLDESKLYAQRLRAAGIKVNRFIIPGMIHGFIIVNLLKESNDAIEIIAKELKQS